MQFAFWVCFPINIAVPACSLGRTPWSITLNMIQSSYKKKVTWLRSTVYHTHQLFKMRKGRKNHKHCMLVIQNALFIHFNTDDIFTIARKYLIHNFEIFSSTCTKKIVESLRIKSRWLRQTQIRNLSMHWRCMESEDPWKLANTWNETK